MLLIRGRICLAKHRYATANNKYIENYNKDKVSSYLAYWDAINLYGWAISQKVSVGNFELKKNTCQFNEKFIKDYNENSHILEIDVEYPKKLYELHNDLPLLPERMKIKKCCKLVCHLYNKKTMSHT